MRAFGQLAFINGAGLLRQLQLVQRSGHRIVQFLGRSEVSGEHAACPAPHLFDELLLSRLSLDVPLHKRKDGAPGLGLPVLLVGRGDPRGLPIPVAGAEQEQDDIRPAHAGQAGLLWRIGRGCKVLRSFDLVPKDGCSPGRRVSERLESPHDRTDEDLHPGEYRTDVELEELVDAPRPTKRLNRRRGRGCATCGGERLERLGSVGGNSLEPSRGQGSGTRTFPI